MRFYRENKVNPLGLVPAAGRAAAGLLLAVLHAAQGPALRHLPGGPDGRRRPAEASGDMRRRAAMPGFLFIPDLTDKATGWVLVVLIVLYVGSQLLSTLLMSTTTDRNQKMIMLALPFVFVIFVIQFPAGLLLYWITTNCWTIVQQTSCASAWGRCDHRRPHGRGGDRGPEDKRRESGRRRRQREPARSGELGGASRGRPRARARPRRPAAVPAAQEEEALRETPMSDEPATESASCSSSVSEALGVDAEVEVVEDDGRDPRHAARRRPRAVHRPPRSDDRRGPAPGVQDRRARPRAGAARGRSTRRATASGASRCCSARPTKRPRPWSAGAGPSRSTR